VLARDGLPIRRNKYTIRQNAWVRGFFAIVSKEKRTRRQNQLGYPAQIVSIAMSRFVRGGSAQGGAKQKSTYTLTGLEVNLRVERKSYVSLYSHQKGMAILIVHADCRVGRSAAIGEQWARVRKAPTALIVGGEKREEASKQTHNLTHFAD
jgi:hypothetical protein